MNEPAGPVVVAVDEQGEVVVEADRWGRLATAALRDEGRHDGELNLLFVAADEMAELNANHMGKDGPTDVLSFPLDTPSEVGLGAVLLGDIVVCPTRAAAQASDHRGDRGHDGSLDDELALLVVHGVLHVTGWDHATDDEAEAMEAREDELLARLHRVDR